MAATGIEALRGRLALADVARGAAIVAMVVYHAAFDLWQANLIAVDVPGDLGWKVLARLIAGSFLALVGVSLVLATRNGFNRGAFLRRLAFVLIGAALVSLSTWWFEPRTWVFFGILHLIAVASVLALPFLRLPGIAVGAAAVFFLALPWVFRSGVFNAGPLLWLGLYTEPPTSVDFTPLFPWFGVVLAGILLGRLILAKGGPLWRWQPGAPLSWLGVAGRWSLIIYLLHQPLLVGAVSLAAAYLPPSETAVRSNFMGACMAGADPADPMQNALCTCMFDGLWGTTLFGKSTLEEMTPDERYRFETLLGACQAAAESAAAPSPAN